MNTKDIVKAKYNFQSLSVKELNRFRLLQKMKSFCLNKAIKDGKLIYKSDAKEHLQKLLELTIGTLHDNLISETQLKKLIFKNKEELTKIIDKQTLASLLEVAYFNSDKEFQLSIKSYQAVFEKELNDKIESIINIKLNTDENIVKYKKQIIEFSGRKEDTLRGLIDEIKLPCEFKKVIVFMVVCDLISELPKRDRKKLYEEKIKFNRTKERIIQGLKELNLSCNEVEKKEFSSSDALGWNSYETTLKHYKRILFFALIDRCKTGVKRANEIVRILDYL